MSNFTRLKKVLFGKPLSNNVLAELRLRKLKALPILSSDLLSSVAYGTEAILRTLVVGGAAALAMSLPVAIAICVLIILLSASYWQTIAAYPNGGGAFTVARENLGQGASLLAAAALLIDYLLTVAVSITAGVLAVTSAFSALLPHTILLSLITLTFIAVVNLRGVCESASAFALPSYAFIFFILLLFIALIWKVFTHDVQPLALPSQLVAPHQEVKLVSMLLIFRAFAMGCTALTGIECIANGVPVFEKPEVKNAQITLIIMIILLILMFFGISYFAHALNLVPNETESLLSMLAHLGYGNSFFYYIFQASTALILLLAANTAFTGFPRLASILSQHNYLPKQLNSLGDRLSFSNGIILLAVLSGFLIVIFNGDPHVLLPLYSIGVFLAFSLSQLGMVVCWYRLRSKNWQLKLMVNLIGFITTTIALMVIIGTKFTQGAWIVISLIPLSLLMFNKIYRHYCDVERELAISPEQANHYLHKMQGIKPKVVIPVAKMHRGTLAAINFAYSISDDVVAVVVKMDEEKTHALRKLWEKLALKVPLIVLNSPYRSTIAPLDAYIKAQDRRDPERGLCVIVMPKAITTRWWHNLLHNHRAALFKASLLYYSNQHHKNSTRIFVDVPYQLKF